MTSRAGRKALPPLNRTLRCPTRSATCHKECIRKKKNMLVIFERAACVIPGDSHVFERNFVDVLPRLDDILKLLVSHQSPPEQVHEVVFVIGPLILGGGNQVSRKEPPVSAARKLLRHVPWKQ
jgi:hypothetical protein